MYGFAAHPRARRMIGSMLFPPASGRSALLFGATVLALCLTGATVASEPTPTPSAPQSSRTGQTAAACPIVADPPKVDFGIVEPGTKVAATIKLFNPLDRAVRIVLSKPSCTCTTVEMAGKEIPARSFIEMPMSMQTSKAVGKKAAKVDLVFEGVPVPLSVMIEAETAYAVRANPPFVDALAPERMTGFFELLSTDGTPFSVKTIDGKPAVTADGTAMKPATRQVVRYDLRTPGLHTGVPPFLIVETDHPKCPALDLRVRHESTRISPVLNFAEFRSNLGVLETGKPVEFEVELKHAGPKRVDRISSANPGLKFELVGQKSDGDSLLVTVRVTRSGLQSGPFLTTCTFGAGPQTSDLWLFGIARD